MPLGQICCTKRDNFLPEGDYPLGFDPSQIGTNGQVDEDKIVQDYNQVTAFAEWRQLAVILDRICFVSFLLIVIIAVIAVQFN